MAPLERPAPPVVRHRHRPTSWWARPLERTLVLGTLAIGGALLGGAGLDTAYQTRTMPGVRYGDLSLAGLSEAQVKAVIDVHAAPLLNAPVVFVHGEREWRPAASEVGLGVDTPAMAEEAMGVRRGLPAVLRLPHAVYLGAARPDIPLRGKIDPDQLAAFLNALAAEVDRPAVNAALAVRSGRLVVGQSAAGQRVDVAETVRRVRPPSTLEGPQRVEVAVVVVPPAVAEASVSDAQAVASKILAAPLSVKAAARTWSLSPAELGAMLEFKPDVARHPEHAEGGQERLVAVLNEPKVAAYVRSLAAQVDRAPLDAQLRWSGSGVTVVREGRDGIKLEQTEAVAALIAQAMLDEREVVLKTSVTKPQVASDNLPQLGIRQLLATGSSKFAGSSPERVNNIRVAAGRLDGTIIPAGSTFSFLNALGPITKENGYQEGLTIQGDATVPGIGGGVCQVSTTAFRAAFFAGLPIVERHQHTYRVSYYEQDKSPVGFDAAVYNPGVDLRFKNDTSGAILIQTSVDTASSTIAFRFFGSPTGRDVKLDASKANEVKAGPRLADGTDPALPKGTRKQVEWSSDGADATIRRTIVQDGQLIGGGSFFSRYSPWREKWVVGSGA